MAAGAALAGTRAHTAKGYITLAIGSESMLVHIFSKILLSPSLCVHETGVTAVR